MKIAVIGAGNVGSALGKAFIKAGHSVVFGVREATSTKSQKLVDAVPGVSIMSVNLACQEAEVIIISIPPDSIIGLIPQLGDISDKILIDTTNSIKSRPEPYATAFHALKALTKSENIVKCFNTTGFENMADPIYSRTGIDMFMAGNNPDAKQIALKLSLEIGFENCHDFGGDDKVELLEKFALSWINLAIMQGQGRDIAFKVIKR